MFRSSHSSGSAISRDITQIGNLLRDLEGHIGQLARSVTTEAREVGSNMPDMISQAVAEISERVRDTMQARGRGVGAEAARVGNDAWRKVEGEVVNHPLTALAIAAGIGFLIGALNRSR